MPCPKCGGYLIYWPSYNILNCESVPADLRCFHCGTSVIYTTNNYDLKKDKQGSGYSKKEPIKKICICGCNKEFVDRTSTHSRKFFDHSHKIKYRNLINNLKRVRDDEDRRIERIKWKLRKLGGKIPASLVKDV